MWRKQVEEDFKHIEKSNCNFEGNLRPNYTPLCPKMEKKMQIQGQIK
jgi:hypothetical protein